MSVRYLVTAGAVTIACFILALVAARIGGVDAEAALADPQEATGLRFLGIVSNVGVLLWAAAVTACLLGASLSSARGHDPAAAFFKASAAVMAMLLLDDFLLVHEYADDVLGFFVDFDPTRRRKNLLELMVFALHGIVVAFYLVRHRRAIAATDHRVLGLGGLFLAASLFIDMGVLDFGASMISGDVSGRTETIVEEAAKLLGISYLTVYYFAAASSLPDAAAPLPIRIRATRTDVTVDA